jgi:NADH:ubiquinone oxidoreductase subunit E
VAEILKIPLIDIFGVITFYGRFTLEPVGRFQISICMGTACYVQGADKILDKIKLRCGIKEGETTEDGKFSIDACRCIGACGLAPVITIKYKDEEKTTHEDVYGRLFKIEEVDGIMEKYENM